MNSSSWRLGTRDSALALWQAHKVRDLLTALGHQIDIVPIKSQGDIELEKPLYELGITGIFTKSLDLALIENRIDFAVHSLKDVPTALAHGLDLWAVLERADPRDVLIHKGLGFLENREESTIATGSLRRQAQWLHRYPHHQVTNLRGNVQTRLQKLKDNSWDGAVFAHAGLNRMELLPEQTHFLDWMIPAPAQGAIAIVGRKTEVSMAGAIAQINHRDSAFCVEVERKLLRELEGGCTAPIGAFAKLIQDQLVLKAGLFSTDGKQAVVDEIAGPQAQGGQLAIALAQRLKNKGGDAILEELKNG
jgi:hydroxymethylbilane synthase